MKLFCLRLKYYQLDYFDLLLKDYWNLLVLILSRPVNAPFILLLRLFGIRFQTASVTYIHFLSSKSSLKLIFFFKLFWIHRCNLFVFIVCAPWVLFEDCAPYKNPPLLLLLLLLLLYCIEKSKLNILLRFQPNPTYGFWDTAVERFFVFYCFCQYIDKVNEENWQNMLININFWQYFTNSLWVNLHTTFIFQNFGLKLPKCSYSL